jgi:hypothetical protein
MSGFRIGRKFAQHTYPTAPGGSGGVSPLAGPWTEVIATPGLGTFVFTAAPGQRKFLVDSTNRPVEIDLAALPVDAVVVVVDWGAANGGVSSMNIITVKPPVGGMTIADPSNAGKPSAAATIASDGADVWWQVVATSRGVEMVQIVGG